MKEIKAYIQKDELDLVLILLAGIEGLSDVSACSIRGFGRHRDIIKPVNLSTHIKIEAVCEDAIKDTVVAVILKVACRGCHGNGKIFVSTVDEAYRIETGVQLPEGSPQS